MIRTVILAGVVAFSAPAFAQDAQPAPAAPAAETQAPAPAADAAAQPGQPAAPASNSVSQVIDADFPSYDKDQNGELSQAEFSDWMLKLRTASEGAGKTPEAELKAWAGQAFAQADADKNKTVSKGELTKFLAG